MELSKGIGLHLKRWIRPRWGTYLLHEIKAVKVEEWLRSLALAPKSKVNLRGLFHFVYQHGRRWEFTDANPIAVVHQPGGRRSIPRVLSSHDVRLLLDELEEPYRTMILVAACLGLRASEIMGLQWADFDWRDLTLLVRRSVVQGRVGETKTEASCLSPSGRPISGGGAQRTFGPQCISRILALGVANSVGRPRSQQSILRWHLTPVALRAGIGKIGWHTFRHSYST